jgi:hypothetical protein
MSEPEDPEGVLEARVLCARVDEAREAKLADASQPLHLGRVEEVDEEAAERRIPGERDGVVDGIAEEAWFVSHAGRVTPKARARHAL